MTQDEIIEMAEQAGMTQDGDMWFSFGKGDMDVEHKHLVAFAKLVAAKKQEDIIQIIKETPFSNWFQADVIEAIRARGDA
jgi:alkylhydroperoxidase/carboxymuconolactone decarboxylase family protein YurZ